MKLKDNLTLQFIPIIIVGTIFHAAVALSYFYFYDNSQLELIEFIKANIEILFISSGGSLVLMFFLWYLFRNRLDKQLILKLDYLDQFIREFGKANPIPIDGIIPVADEIDQLLESVLRMRNNYAVQKKSLEKLAYFDKLTGLPNRDYLVKVLSRLLKQADRKNELLAVMHLDLNNFREINEHIGRDLGDKLLTKVGKRLEGLVRAGDLVERQNINDSSENMVARIIGVEFTLLLVDIEQSENAHKVALRIMSALDEPFIIEQHNIQLSGNIGISLFPGDSDNADGLLKCADFALTESKKEESNLIEYYTKEMNVIAFQKSEIEKNIRLALEEDQLILQFQPRVSLQNGDISAFEALLRWENPSAGMVPAAEFLEIADETYLICEIGNWVFDRVCKSLREWRELGKTNLRASINISSAQLYSNDTYELIQNYLKLYQLPGDSLEIEVTEASIMKDERKAIKNLKQLSSLGILISLDEFGKNYTSLSLLQKLPINTIKIDRNFICYEMFEEGGKQLLKSIISIAKSFNLTSVACGIEEEFQVNFFKEAECDYIQGYYFSRPIADELVIQFIDSWVSDLNEYS